MNDVKLHNDLQDLYNLVNSGHLEIAQRLTAIETQMTSLVGNGQPGRIALLEAEVRSNTSFRYKVVGYTAAVSSFVSLLWLGLWTFVPNIWTRK